MRRGSFPTGTAGEVSVDAGVDAAVEAGIETDDVARGRAPALALKMLDRATVAPTVIRKPAATVAPTVIRKPAATKAGETTSVKAASEEINPAIITP